MKITSLLKFRLSTWIGLFINCALSGLVYAGEAAPDLAVFVWSIIITFFVAHLVVCLSEQLDVSGEAIHRYGGDIVIETGMFLAVLTLMNPTDSPVEFYVQKEILLIPYVIFMIVIGLVTILPLKTRS